MARKEREIYYYKPNMANLKGRLGRRIIQTIANSPKPDDTELYERSAKLKAKILALREAECEAKKSVAR